MSISRDDHALIAIIKVKVRAISGPVSLRTVYVLNLFFAILGGGSSGCTDFM